jgi:phospho-N-acetylmuramoyl-pentapeptide-transferase
MGEVGYAALAFVLPIIAFITDTVLLLPIIGFMLLISLLSSVIQRIAIRVFKKRVFKAAPLHHHFELLGWSLSQIVMRYWIVSIIMAILGFALVVVSI